MSGQPGVPGDWEPATEACLGTADGFPWTRVRGLEGGIAVQVSTFSLVSEVYTEELMALSRASRPGGIVVLFVPPNPRHNVLTGAWPQGLRRCHHIRVLKSKMGHSLRCQGSGPLPIL